MKTNIRESIKTIVLSKQDIYKGNLILVNKNFPLKQQHSNSSESLISVSSQHPDIFLQKTAVNMLTQLMIACKGENQIVPVSGYRSLGEQQQIFKDSLSENGEAFTLKYVAYPNHSEHQSGLAIDVAENKENIDFIRPFFPYDGICQSFRMKAARYGFIERYQKGKEAIIGISHEPWHFRYIGFPHSEIIQENDYTLEEYIDFLRAFPYDGKHLLFENIDQQIEIFYVKATDEPQNTIFLAEDVPYQVSGNNNDGFIITVWRIKL
ncbi:MAG TPA: M15 family metallopeptidase [Ruminiclostridium sp.]